MKTEHCEKNKDLRFESTNRNIRTTPAREWGFVVRDKNHDRSETPPQKEMSGNRRIPDVNELLKLEASRRAKLTRHEVIAVVLYSGPMVRILKHTPHCSHLFMLILFL